MKQLLAALLITFAASAASAGVMMEKTELDDAQIARVNELYPDDQSGKYGHFLWFRVGPHVISIPCLLYTSPSPRDRARSRMPSSA